MKSIRGFDFDENICFDEGSTTTTPSPKFSSFLKKKFSQEMD
jgi:hypothetical protein